MRRPLCLVLLPGATADASGHPLDFDAIYSLLIAPAIDDAGLKPLREPLSAAGLATALEHLSLSAFAVVDLTAAGAELCYGLGLRDAVAAATTVRLRAADRDGPPLALDTFGYRLDSDGRPLDPAGDREALAERLRAVRQPPHARPVRELVEAFPEIQRLKTDLFRERVDYAAEVKSRLEQARRDGAAAVAAIERSLGETAALEAGVVIDLLLSYRAVRAWGAMLALVDRMAPPLAETVMVREQRAFALNRAGRGDEAERLLRELIAERGPSSESCSLLGRIFKDRWEAATEAGDTRATTLLEQAIAAYLQGFEADWRDAFPGINAVTLMELREPPDPRRGALLPVVRYAVERRVAGGRADYWDYATRLELAVLANARGEAGAALADARAHQREVWEGESTARNLRLIRKARGARGEPADWIGELEKALAADP